MQPLAVARDDEERVVDPDTETDHRRKLRRELRHHHDVREDADDGEPACDARDRGEDRQPHREDRTERDQEDDDGREQPDELGGPLEATGLEHPAAGLERDAVDLLAHQREILDPRRGRVRYLAGPLVELDVGVRNPLAGCDLSGAFRVVRAGDAADVRHPHDLRQHLADAGTYLGLVDATEARRSRAGRRRPRALGTSPGAGPAPSSTPCP